MDLKVLRDKLISKTMLFKDNNKNSNSLSR